MDPNTTLKELEDLLTINKYYMPGTEPLEIQELCNSLRSWLKAGGFPPNWNNYPNATNYYMQRAQR